jgi:hypothetical protein
MAAPTSKDWGKIHAMAWRDRDFRKLLETDPKKALAKYGKTVGKRFDKVVRVSAKPKGVPAADHHKHSTAIAPPACC